MSDFENEQKTEMEEAEGGGLDVRNASARAFHIIKKRYNLPQETLDSGKVYYLQSKTRPFDSILRRSPAEICKDMTDFKVPLGTSCVQAVVSLYGLSNGAIYPNERWQKMLMAYNENPCGETFKPLLSFLHAAAVVKCIEVNGGRKSAPNDDIGFCQEISEVEDKLIVSYFMDMVR